MKGLVKVRGSGGITGGVLIVSGAGGTVVTIGSNTHEKVIGKAVQTFATDGDDGVVMITLR